MMMDRRLTAEKGRMERLLCLGSEGFAGAGAQLGNDHSDVKLPIDRSSTQGPRVSCLVRVRVRVTGELFESPNQ